MKILIHAGTSVSPYYDGTTLRTFHITPYLAQTHNLHLIQERWEWEKKSKPLNPAGYDEQWLNQYYSKLWNIWHHQGEKLRYGMIWESEELYCTLDQIIAQEQYDVIYSQTESFPLYALKHNQNKYNVIGGPTDSFHLHYAREIRTATMGRRVRLMAKWGLYVLYQITVLNRMPYWTMVAKKDIDSMRFLSAGNEIRLIPYGVNLDYYKLPTNIAKNPKQVLFVGTMGKNATNEKAIIWFLMKVWPQVVSIVPEATLKIVGRNPSEELERWAEQSVQVNLVGYVADTRSFYWEAGIFILPMQSGGGVKNKLLEALASNSAVVSTRIGIEGVLGEKNSDILIVTDEPNQMALAIIRLMTNPEDQVNLAEKGRLFVTNNFSWKLVAEKLEEYMIFVSRSRGAA